MARRFGVGLYSSGLYSAATVLEFTATGRVAVGGTCQMVRVLTTSAIDNAIAARAQGVLKSLWGLQAAPRVAVDGSGTPRYVFIHRLAATVIAALTSKGQLQGDFSLQNEIQVAVKSVAAPYIGPFWPGASEDAETWVPDDDAAPAWTPRNAQEADWS